MKLYELPQHSFFHTIDRNGDMIEDFMFYLSHIDGAYSVCHKLSYQRHERLIVDDSTTYHLAVWADVVMMGKPKVKIFRKSDDFEFVWEMMK